VREDGKPCRLWQCHPIPSIPSAPTHHCHDRPLHTKKSRRGTGPQPTRPKKLPKTTCPSSNKELGMCWWQEGQWEGQELENRMCCYNIKSESRLLNTDFHVGLTSKTGMCGGLRKTVVVLVVGRARKGAFVRRYRCISCVRTEVHMFTCLFVHICLQWHMTYTNVILGNMWITTFLTTQLDEACTHPWSKMVSRMTPETFSCHKKIYERAWSHTKTSQINRQNHWKSLL
jgi:hypothetical protein